MAVIVAPTTHMAASPELSSPRVLRSARGSTPSPLEARFDGVERPALLIRDDTFNVEDSIQWRKALQDVKQGLDSVISAVARVETSDPSIPISEQHFLSPKT